MELRLPELSENNDDVVITKWHFGENDFIKEGEDLVEVTTDKATFDIPAPCGGKIKKIYKSEGDSIKVNEILAEIN